MCKVTAPEGDRQRLSKLLDVWLAHLSLAAASDLVERGVRVPVLCKDCKQWTRSVILPSGHLICPLSGMKILATDYCSRGERR